VSAPVREVVAVLGGHRRDGATRAHDAVTRAEALVRAAMLDLALSRAHMADVLAVIADADPADLHYDPATGSVYREVSV